MAFTHDPMVVGLRPGPQTTSTPRAGFGRPVGPTPPKPPGPAQPAEQAPTPVPGESAATAEFPTKEFPITSATEAQSAPPIALPASEVDEFPSNRHSSILLTPLLLTSFTAPPWALDVSVLLNVFSTGKVTAQGPRSGFKDLLEERLGAQREGAADTGGGRPGRTRPRQSSCGRS